MKWAAKSSMFVINPYNSYISVISVYIYAASAGSPSPRRVYLCFGDHPNLLVSLSHDKDLPAATVFAA
jgi:hypothetical protein